MPRFQNNYMYIQWKHMHFFLLFHSFLSAIIFKHIFVHIPFYRYQYSKSKLSFYHDFDLLIGYIYSSKNEGLVISLRLIHELIAYFILLCAYLLYVQNSNGQVHVNKYE